MSWQRTIKQEDIDVTINTENGELISFCYKGQEYMHGGGKPDEAKDSVEKEGWSHSEIVMFPIVGPVPSYNVVLGESEFSMDQHGVARCQGWLVTKEGNCILLEQRYNANSSVPNPKHEKDDRHPSSLQWPFSYVLQKRFSFQNDMLQVEFSLENKSSEPMPYMLGWHPAFRTNGSFQDGNVEIDGKNYSLQEVREKETLMVASDGGKPIIYTNGDHRIEVTSDFGGLMVWTPTDNMFCIEPVTQIETEGIINSNTFLKTLQPNETKKYAVTIKLG